MLAANLSHALVWALGTSSSTPTLSLATNWRVLLFRAFIACGTWIIFGVAPALRATRLDPAEAMKRGGRSLTQGGSRLTTERLMVVMQVTASLVLLVAALLFCTELLEAGHARSGLRREGITIAFMGYADLKLPAEQLNDFQRQLVDESAASRPISSLSPLQPSCSASLRRLRAICPRAAHRDWIHWTRCDNNKRTDMSSSRVFQPS